MDLKPFLQHHLQNLALNNFLQIYCFLIKYFTAHLYEKVKQKIVKIKLKTLQ